MDAEASVRDWLLDDRDNKDLEEAIKLDKNPPPTYVTEVNKFSNTVVSSATIALFRALLNPPAGEAAAGGGGAAVSEEAVSKLPAWFRSEFKQKMTFQGFLGRYARDTVALTSAVYLMEGAENVSRSLRQVDDAGNKMIGGVAAGGMLGILWYPGAGQSFGRAFMSATGALVGYIVFNVEKNTKEALLQQQKILEKELLRKPEGELKQQIEPHYLRALMRIKHRQAMQEKKEKQHEAAQSLGGGPSATGGGFTRRPDEVAATERRGWGPGVGQSLPPTEEGNGDTGGIRQLQRRPGGPFGRAFDTAEDGGLGGRFPSNAREVVQIGRSGDDLTDPAASSRGVATPGGRSSYAPTAAGGTIVSSDGSWPVVVDSQEESWKSLGNSASSRDGRRPGARRKGVGKKEADGDAPWLVISDDDK